jgi:RNA polymerase sigma factor (TIGR02999 family)
MASKRAEIPHVPAPTLYQDQHPGGTMNSADTRARINETLRGPVGRNELDVLVPLVYDELRRLARSYLRRERPDHTLQPTALVHEAFERLVDQRNVEWEGRSHFMAIAAIAMRRLLLQHAEKRRAVKRGGGKQSLTLDDTAAALLGGQIDLGEILDLNASLQRLAAVEPRHAQLVELRVFAGMTMAECATHLGTSLRTAERDWRVASAWLRRELARSAEKTQDT